MTTVRTATASDLPFLPQYERHLSAVSLTRILQRQQILVIERADTQVGWLRWGLFWDEIPFMNMLFVLDGHRGNGCGAKLVSAWEEQAVDAGYEMAMTSTLSDEAAQHFYRRLGYVDTGTLCSPEKPPRSSSARVFTAEVMPPDNPSPLWLWGSRNRRTLAAGGCSVDCVR